MKRSKTDRIIAGVCGGLAKATGLNPWLFRIIFIFGGGLWIYLLMLAFVKEEQ
jgi:phage shock protein C